MADIKIADLPVLKELDDTELRGIFGGNQDDGLYYLIGETVGSAGKKIRLRKTVRKNRITLNKLKGLAYTVKYRMQIVDGSKVVNKTDFTPASDFDLSH